MHLQSTADTHGAEQPPLLSPLDDRERFCPALDRLASALAFVVALAGIALSCLAAFAQTGAHRDGIARGALALTSRGLALGRRRHRGEPGAGSVPRGARALAGAGGGARARELARA